MRGGKRSSWSCAQAYPGWTAGIRVRAGGAIKDTPGRRAARPGDAPPGPHKGRSSRGNGRLRRR
ncbi:hypothetical protein Sru01_41270 [Sphaerisporangium rufum]|uniref:Uncharacterized protein n=1 Tax=Sphaerisporangium rufum TaxID=1381558 RepID=A0A919R8A9_9ACTN|nr:hypothetical protein Sru01_41270 [Sphaerisporangium rufum]